MWLERLAWTEQKYDFHLIPAFMKSLGTRADVIFRLWSIWRQIRELKRSRIPSCKAKCKVSVACPTSPLTASMLHENHLRIDRYVNYSFLIFHFYKVHSIRSPTTGNLFGSVWGSWQTFSWRIKHWSYLHMIVKCCNRLSGFLSQLFYVPHILGQWYLLLHWSIFYHRLHIWLNISA